MKLKIKDIVIKERQRVDLGDCSGLADSLRETGQIQAIGVNERNELIWGRRRLEAATLLGWEEIEVVQRTGLTPEMEQEIEYEEDARRKDRTWQEKCLAVAKLMRLKEARTGEAWTVRRMADFTGMSKSSVGYMKQVAAGLAVLPRDEELWACEGYLEAIKLLVGRTHKQVNDELERRRAVFMANALPPKQPASPDAEPTAEPVQQLDTTAPEPAETSVWIHGSPHSFEDESLDNLIEGRASCVVGYNPSLRTLPLLHYILASEGFAVLFFDSLQDAAVFAHAAEGFVAMPYPLIWNRLTNDPDCKWPFRQSYAFGYVITKSAPAKSGRCAGVISAAQTTPGLLPAALVEAAVSATCPDSMPVYCLPGVPPAAVAATGRTPLWYEPDAARYDTLREELVAYYQETIPGVVIKDRS